MEQTELLEAVAEGRRSLRDVLGVDRSAIAKVEALGAAAFVARRFDQAAQIFAGLVALEPDHPEHHLHLAHALAGLGHVSPAILSISAYLEGVGEPAKKSEPVTEVVQALLMRSQLYVQQGERVLAKADLSSAEVRAGKDGSLLALVRDCRAFVDAP